MYGDKEIISRELRWKARKIREAAYMKMSKEMYKSD